MLVNIVCGFLECHISENIWTMFTISYTRNSGCSVSFFLAPPVGFRGPFRPIWFVLANFTVVLPFSSFLVNLKCLCAICFVCIFWVFLLSILFFICQFGVFIVILRVFFLSILRCFWSIWGVFFYTLGCLGLIYGCLGQFGMFFVVNLGSPTFHY